MNFSECRVQRNTAGIFSENVTVGNIELVQLTPGGVYRA